MIEINLLPGAKRAKRVNPAKIDVGQALRELFTNFKDPLLVGSVSSAVVGVLAVVLMWFFQGRASDALDARAQKAHADSVRFTQVIKQRALAEAVRDSVVRQVRIINTIDATRFVWPHILEEVSRALPPYTWLVSIQQTSAVPSLTPEIEAGLFTGAEPSKIQAEADSALKASSVLRIRIVGQTVDIQALTRFMRQLEASPFLEDVQPIKTETILAQPSNREVTQFTLDMRWQQPDSTVIRRVPFMLGAR